MLCVMFSEYDQSLGRQRFVIVLHLHAVSGALQLRNGFEDVSLINRIIVNPTACIVCSCFLHVLHAPEHCLSNPGLHVGLFRSTSKAKQASEYA